MLQLKYHVRLKCVQFKIFILQKVKNLLPQLSSSDRSTQSKSPSHFQLPWMHSPLPQWNCTEVHWCAGILSTFGAPQLLGHSSEPSEQSASPSHAHRRGTHTVLLHWKAVALQVAVGQDASSLLSSQSTSPSHTNDSDTHWPLAQRNSLRRHSRGTVGGWMTQPINWFTIICQKKINCTTDSHQILLAGSHWNKRATEWDHVTCCYDDHS